MLTLEQIKNELGVNLCRQCINDNFNCNLKTSNCIYSDYQYTCSNCQKLRNIVCGLRLSGKIKLLFK